MTAKKINDTSAFHDADSFQPHQYCEPEHLGGEGIAIGGLDADHRIVRSTGGGTDQQDSGQSGGESIA